MVFSPAGRGVIRSATHTSSQLLLSYRDSSLPTKRACSLLHSRLASVSHPSAHDPRSACLFARHHGNRRLSPGGHREHPQQAVQSECSGYRRPKSPMGAHPSAGVRGPTVHRRSPRQRIADPSARVSSASAMGTSADCEVWRRTWGAAGLTQRPVNPACSRLHSGIEPLFGRCDCRALGAKG